MANSAPPSPSDEKPSFDLNLQHGHKDLVRAVAFNTYGDRCATGSVDGKIRVFNRHKDGTWRLCDTWSAHGGEVLEVSSLSLPLSHQLSVSK
jgi:nucleoporin SEH1